MKSVATRRFWALFQALPSDVQSLAVKNYHLWRRNPGHPPPHFRRLQGNEGRYTVRVERSLSRARQAIGGEDELGMDRDPRRIRPAYRLLSAVDGLRALQMKRNLASGSPTPLKYIEARRHTRTRFWRRLGAIHLALDLVTRGFLGLFARGFPGFSVIVAWLSISR